MRYPLQGREHHALSRRDVLKATSCGFGYLALAGLAAEQASAESPHPLAPQPPHFTPRAKRVIFLCMQGGPSHVDTFDYKPKLQKDTGKEGRRNKSKLLGSQWPFRQYGESGLWISDLFRHLAHQADDLCLLRGMKAKTGNHQQAHIQLHTGNAQFIRPSMGAWVLYGLGTENRNLPGFVNISPPPTFSFGGAQNYGSAFLPAIYQGTRIRNPREASIPNVANRHLPTSAQRRQLDLLQSTNRGLLGQETVNDHNPELEGLINSYELAFRMQHAVPQLMDLSTEPKHTLQLYGVGEKETDGFGRQCLYARRLAEAGVRFIELTHGNWDQHGGLSTKLPGHCRATDKPIGALLADLKQRGLLDETLVVWGGEFGRTPDAKLTSGGSPKDGRDHNPSGFTFWMAGGGVKQGLSYGATDEHGYKAADGQIGIHDLHATILHLLGLDHTKLTFRYSGRDFRLTDVHGEVVHDLLA